MLCVAQKAVLTLAAHRERLTTRLLETWAKHLLPELPQGHYSHYTTVTRQRFVGALDRLLPKRMRVKMWLLGRRGSVRSAVDVRVFLG